MIQRISENIKCSKMIDLHIHSFFSDGELVPSEIVRRMEVLGYEAIAITDHADSSNLEFILPRIIEVSKRLNEAQPVKVIPGIELTHVPPSQIGKLASEARSLGAALVVVHGETVVEPVSPGTNLAAIEAKVDILAHPGLISLDEARLARKNDVFLEISGRSGHSFTNGHVIRMAEESGAKVLLNSDAHAPHDFLSRDLAQAIAMGAGGGENALDEMLANARSLLKRIGYST